MIFLQQILAPVLENYVINYFYHLKKWDYCSNLKEKHEILLRKIIQSVTDFLLSASILRQTAATTKALIPSAEWQFERRPLEFYINMFFDIISNNKLQMS